MHDTLDIQPPTNMGSDSDEGSFIIHDDDGDSESDAEFTCSESSDAESEGTETTGSLTDDRSEGEVIQSYVIEDGRRRSLRQCRSPDRYRDEDWLAIFSEGNIEEIRFILRDDDGYETDSEEEEEEEDDVDDA